MTCTELEAKVLRSIATNSYNDMNYGRPSCYKEAGSDIWTRLINDAGSPSGVIGKALSGVCSSLSRKGYMLSFEDGEDSTVRMTEEGWIAMIQFFGSIDEAFKNNRY